MNVRTRVMIVCVRVGSALEEVRGVHCCSKVHLKMWDSPQLVLFSMEALRRETSHGVDIPRQASSSV